ncbi:GNAT family N-acetyltransferase [Cohnella lupini]|uniref:Acetyltransferase (GNAT) family protein n=1 Tax=Cohnella lupini TaxID=1294267 RepID=A0A3D9IVC6_9BACL|nr:GNAT family N-acetyltransferase [Cohnella lupini]RED65066.1 acetyltransferase (GNAT) family protein [Cohnella lupini]
MGKGTIADKVVGKDAKSKYRELCGSRKDMSLFDQDWWLDIACGGSDNWDVCLVERNGDIVASLPYHIVKRYLFNVIQMPELTLTMGIWIRYPDNQSMESKLSFEREIYSEIIDKLPQVDYSYQHFNWNITNWSIFFWKGFRQTTRYTFVFEDLRDLDRIYANFRDNIRAEIRKAEKVLTVIESDDLERFNEINRKTFDRQNVPLPHNVEILTSLDQACRERGCRKIWFAVDEKNQIHSAIYMIWDENCAYYLLGGADPELRKSGSHSFLLWHAIKEMSKVTKQFDLHGGMHEPVERFFRALGAKQQPYFQVTRIKGRLFKLAYYVKQALSQITAVITVSTIYDCL